MNKGSLILKKIRDCPKRSAIFSKINPILSDVSLRDGIQNASIENFPTHRKIFLYHTILSDYQPQNLEIGSLCSPSVLPIMKDSIALHNYSREHLKTRASHNPDIYMFIPSVNKITDALHNNVQNFSFITSVSDQFQIRNTKKTIEETKTDFDFMFYKWFREPCNYKTKLYISCINSCPILGEIDNDFIVKEILYYDQKYNFNELCLSDTTGSLKYDDFEYIVDSCLFFGIAPSKISFHFHCSPTNSENLKQNLFYCFSKNLKLFDVSILETGGCSVTMAADKLSPNLSYDMFYSILDNYIERKIYQE